MRKSFLNGVSFLPFTKSHITCYNHPPPPACLCKHYPSTPFSFFHFFLHFSANFQTKLHIFSLFVYFRKNPLQTWNVQILLANKTNFHLINTRTHTHILIHFLYFLFYFIFHLFILFVSLPFEFILIFIFLIFSFYFHLWFFIFFFYFSL